MSGDKKGKLLSLIKAFDLDTSDVIIGDGPNVGHWVKKPNGYWVVLKNKFGELLWPRGIPGKNATTTTSAGLELEKPEKKDCLFKPDDFVSFISDAGRVKYKIETITKKPFGRTGFWCKLPGFTKLIESAELKAFIESK